MSALPTMTMAEVAKFDGKDGRKAYVVVNGDILDVTSFAGGHPGGEIVLLEWAGRDGTKKFYDLHRHEVLENRLKRLKVANLQGYNPKSAPTLWRELSNVPYAEIDMDNSPYYNDSHKRFRQVLRNYLWDEGIFQWADQAETTGEAPSRELFQKLGKAGYLALCMGKGQHLERIPEPNLWSMAGIKPQEMDLFHTLIVSEERTRMMCPGAEDGLVSGISIGLGPLIKFGPKWMQGDLVQSILMGDKIICLAITEPFVGSDVAGCTTTATKSADGSYYTVRGTKKWITNSVFADYYTTLVRTGDSLSMLLIEKCDEVVVRKIPTDYSLTAGTGLISFEDVRVPAANLIGKEGQGMAITMHNFNMERLGICTMSMGRARRAIEETFLWANQREAFGKKLIEQPVIRNHMAQMIAEQQACYSHYEKIVYAYQLCKTPADQNKLGGPTALLKYRCTRTATLVADLSVQIFGGRAVTKTGMGKNISRYQKSFKLASVYGGSEEIMADLGVRQAMKSFPKNAKL